MPDFGHKTLGYARSCILFKFGKCPILSMHAFSSSFVLGFVQTERLPILLIAEASPEPTRK